MSMSRSVASKAPPKNSTAQGLDGPVERDRPKTSGNMNEAVPSASFLFSAGYRTQGGL
jgi:hypothetical protein